MTDDSPRPTSSTTADQAALALFGREIRLAREARGWSRAFFAQRCGISVSTIKNLESGRGAHPRLETMRRLSDGLGVALTKLVACVDPHPSQPRTTPPEAMWLDALDEPSRALVMALVRVLLREQPVGAADALAGFMARDRGWVAYAGGPYLG